MSGPAEGAKDFLHHRSLQCTLQREQIMRELLRSTQHFDADALHDRLRSKGSKVSRATVYRTLPLLARCGLIREAFRAEGRTQYEVTSAHHDHMLCVRCGKVIEFAENDIEHLQDAVCAKYGFHAIEHRMSIRGICRQCRRRSGRQRARQ